MLRDGLNCILAFMLPFIVFSFLFFATQFSSVEHHSCHSDVALPVLDILSTHCSGVTLPRTTTFFCFKSTS